MHGTVRDLFPRWGKLLTYYPVYWNLSIRALKRSRKVDYDVIVTWESKHGLPLAALRRLLGIKSPKLVILAFAYKGIAVNFLGLGRLAMPGIDHITVPTISEIEYYSKLLNIPRDKITFSSLGWYDMASTLDISERETGDYIFAGGRSGRDYRTLFEAMSGLDAQLIVNARKFNVQGLDCPPNVTIHGFMPLREYYARVARAQFVVLPLQDTPYAVGLGHIVQTMSAGKALIATRTASTVDYIEDGQTGILVAPYDAQEMRSAVTYLLTHPEKAKAMGQKARQRYEEEYTFAAFAKRTYDVLQKVAMPSQRGAESHPPGEHLEG
jgi:glycosyltransferase involved in cell wall biosynthesis